MDDILSKINSNNREEDDGNDLGKNIVDSMQNDQKKPKKYKSYFIDNISSTLIYVFSRRKSVARKQNFPPMDFVRAKQSLGIKTSATLEELSFDDVRQKFVMKVMRDSEKQDTR